MKIDPVKDLKIEYKKPVEKKQEFKIIGRTMRMRGQFLFAYNHETEEVYKIEIQKNESVQYENKKRTSLNKAYINPEHRMLWSLNLKNAKRKFKVLLNL